MIRSVSPVLATLFVFLLLAGDLSAQGVRFGITTDAHIAGAGDSGSSLQPFLNRMAPSSWNPDFAIDIGDFAIQTATGQTTQELHDAQLAGLVQHWGTYSGILAPVYSAMGNHDVGWIQGGDETITANDLYTTSHSGEHITKQEHLAVTGMPGRYYSFDTNGYHMIVLDGNNQRDAVAPPAGNDGVAGAYYLDPSQMTWLASDLAANRQKPKIVFSHEELHHTPLEGSGAGGDVPFPAVGKEESYVDNGWQARELFNQDGNVLACFAGHKHDDRWTVYGNTNYVTLAANHVNSSYAMVTAASDALTIAGVGAQRSYRFATGLGSMSRPAGIVGLWRGDAGQGTIAADSSGNDNDGQLVGNTAWAEGGPFAYLGNHNLAFPDGNGYVNCGHDESLSVDDGSFTVMAWIKAPDGNTNDNLVSKCNTYPGAGWQLMIENTAARIYLRADGGATASLIGTTPIAGSDQWHHVAAVIDRDADTMLLYVDGQLDKSGALGGIMPANSHDLYIGGLYGSPSYGMQGWLDDVILADRAFDWQEVQWFYYNSLHTAPEPGTGVLLAILGLLAIAFRRRPLPIGRA